MKRPYHTLPLPIDPPKKRNRLTRSEILKRLTGKAPKETVDRLGVGIPLGIGNECLNHYYNPPCQLTC